MFHRLARCYQSSLRNKLLLTIPTVSFLIWLLAIAFNLLALGQDMRMHVLPALQRAGMNTDMLAEMFFRQKVTIGMIGLIAFGSQVALIIMFSHKITAPVARLMSGVRRLGQEPMSRVVLPVGGQDEVGQLAATLQELLDTLAAYENKLKEQAHLAAIGETAGMVAHDVRKPLAAMQALVRVLPHRKDDPAFLAAAQRQVEGAIAQAEGLLADVLEFSTDVQLQREPLDPQSLITAAVGEVVRRTPEATVRFAYDLQHTGGIDGDRARLLRVVGNIVENALQAMDGTGTLTFTTREEPGVGELAPPMLVLAIQNDGPVIPAAVLPRLFDPFFTKGKKNGTGLGLAICKRMVEAHGGTIAVTSAPGATTFRLTLPAGALAQRAPASELILAAREITQYALPPSDAGGLPRDAIEAVCAARGRGEPFRLLLVDDEPLFRETVRAQLQTVPEIRSGVQIVEADSAEMAIALLGTTVFTHVITDLALGPDHMDGYALVDWLAAGARGPRVLIHSNKRQPAQDARLAGRPGFAGWLPKPATAAELVRFLAGEDFCGAAPGRGDRRPIVLVVNDDAAVRLALQWELSVATPGVVIREAASVAEAVTALQGGPVDLILSDIDLGREVPDGYALLAQVRTLAPRPPFLFCSGAGRTEATRAAAAGADGFLQLPLAAEQYAVIRQYLPGNGSTPSAV